MENSYSLKKANMSVKIMGGGFEKKTVVKLMWLSKPQLTSLLLR